MAPLAAPLTLAQSRSKPEKRYFGLFTGLQSGYKPYRKLFRLLEAAQVFFGLGQYPAALSSVSCRMPGRIAAPFPCTCGAGCCTC